jgi:hypothetical protein
VTALIQEHADAWFPWGYRASLISDSATLERGRRVELWEVDDTRAPSGATPVAVGTIDYVARTSDYVALTVQCHSDLPSAPADKVLDEVAKGQLVFSVPLLSAERDDSLAAAQAD